MSMLVYGPWVLLLMGVALLGTAIVCALRAESRPVLALLIFSALLGGVAVHGLPFLDPYGQLLDRIVQLGDVDAYLEAFGLIAEGEMPPGYQEAILALAVEDASPQLADALGAAIDRATSTSGHDALVETRVSIDRHRHVADMLEMGLEAAGRLTEAELEELPLPTRRLIAASVLSRSEEDLRRLGLRQGQLRVLSEER